MKIIAAILLVLCIASCKNDELSKSDKELLELQLSIHRDNAALAFRIERIEQEGRLRIKYFDAPNKNRLIELGLKVWENSWNKEQDIMKDSLFTLQKYLNYCKANGYDAKTKIEFLKTK